VRFDKQENQLILEDRQVFDEAEQVLASPNSFSQPMSMTRGTALDGQVPSRENLASLVKYRDELFSKIQKTAEKSINSTASSLHIRLVEKRQGVPNLTPIFVDAVKERGWKI
jgi:hypothetical protein